MTVTVEDLRVLVNAGSSDAVTSVLTRCFAFGQSLVTTYTARVTAGAIPPAVLEEAVLSAAADQFHRRKAPNGILNQQFQGQDGVTAVPVRVGRDPYASIRPLLRPWVSSGLRTVEMTGSLDMP